MSRGAEAMTIDTLLSQLDGVKQRGKRWAAKCPAHDDKSPSLQITEGHSGLLLKCWAGCWLEDICAGLGIHQKDLFYDSADTDPRQRREAAQRHAKEKAARERVNLADGLMVDALREADYFIRSRHNLDISRWTDIQLDNELNALADAYALLERENLQ